MRTGLHSINREQRLYVLKCGNGLSSLGFDVCVNRIKRLEAEIKSTWIKYFQETEGLLPNWIGTPFRKGSKATYKYLSRLQTFAKKMYDMSGRCFICELHPKLSMYYGYRVEVKQYGETIRFNVGRSTGWIPMLLRINNIRSHGGQGIEADEKFDSIVPIRKNS